MRYFANQGNEDSINDYPFYVLFYYDRDRGYLNLENWLYSNVLPLKHGVGNQRVIVFIFQLAVL